MYIPPESPPRHGWLGSWNQLSRKIRKHLSDRYAESGLSEVRVNILEALGASRPNSTQAELAEFLSISESNLCCVVERMRAEGLIVRERSPIDRRKTVLSLTESGERQCELIRQIHQQVEQLMDGTAEDQASQPAHREIDAIRSVLGRLNARLAEERSIA